MTLRLSRAEFIALGIASAGATFMRPRKAIAMGDTLAIMQSEGPRSMDPADHTAVQTGAVLAAMYEGLTRYTETFDVAPSLATAWTADEPATTWRFTLRSGVTFHDGTPCDAAAVAASFARHLEPKRGLAGSGRFRSVIAKVEAADASTIAFTLKAPYPAFTRLLAINQASIVSPTADKTGTLGRNPVGTGPYKFVEWSASDHVTQQIFDKYWGAKPSFPKLRWSWTAEPAVMNMAIRSDDADVVNPLPPAFVAQLRNSPRIHVIDRPGAAVFWVALNAKLKPLDDVRVRQALNYATDRQSLVQTLLFGNGKPANSPLAPVTQYFDPTVTGYAYDIAKAKSLLATAGYPDGISINVAVQEPGANVAEALQGMWAPAGIKLDVQSMETGVWTQAAFGNPDKKAQQKIYSVLASWSSGAVDADLQLRPLYSTAAWAPAGANLGFYSNPDLDKLLDQAGSTTDAPTRQKLYAQAQRIIVNDAPQVLLYIPSDLTAVRANLSGIWLIPGGQVTVTGAKRT